MHSKRSQDLRDALARNGQKQNGNHRIEIFDGLAPPDVELCKPCDLNLRCLGSKQIDTQRALDERRPCARKGSLVRFYYHGTCCLTFDRMTRRVTDHNKYGYSVTTSGNIRKYIHALWDNESEFGMLNLSYDRIDAIIKAFKAYRPQNDKDELWQAV